MDELQKRLQGKEIVIPTYREHHKPVYSIPNIINVDANFGGTKNDYTVFPSKTWRAHMYGLIHQDKLYQEITPRYWRDVVIYHYVDLNRFPFVEQKENYAVFTGRITYEKGVYDLFQACQQTGIPLKVAGGYPPEREKQFLDMVKQHPVVEYLGIIDGSLRLET